MCHCVSNEMRCEIVLVVVDAIVIQGDKYIVANLSNAYFSVAYAKFTTYAKVSKSVDNTNFNAHNEQSY